MMFKWFLHILIFSTSGKYQNKAKHLNVRENSDYGSFNRQKFNKSQINPTLLLCKRTDETLKHYILDCPELNSVRLPIFSHN